MAKKKRKNESRSIAVNFGGVSIGKKTARISMKMQRDEAFSLKDADESLCGRRLTGSIQLGRKNDADGQVTMWDDTERIEGSFDITRMGVSPEEYSFGATFKKTEIDLALLGDFSNGEGRMLIDSVELIPVDVVEEKETQNGSLPGTYKVEGEWAKASLDGLFSGAKLKSLNGAGLETVGDYSKYFEPEKNGHTKQLVDIKGIGQAAATFIEDRMLEFFRDNPVEK